jgi:PAS domain S-box-containing protein
VHQIELEMQNEELRRAQFELTRSRERYFDLYDLAPVGYCTISEAGQILEANLTAATLLGVERGGLVKHPITYYILPEDQDIYYLHRKQLFENGNTPSFELRMLGEGKRVFWARVEAILSKEIGDQRACHVVLSDISDYVLAEERINKLLEDKELLLREVHHRIKNNMSTINSLLTLQAGMVKEPTASMALRDAALRVESMMLLYDNLYQSSGYGSVSVEGFISSLVDQIALIFPQGKALKIEKKIESFSLEVEKMQPLGIIANELLTNTMKYAFVTQGQPAIHIEISLVGSRVHFSLQDNGAGMPESVDFKRSNGFGLMLVDALTRQLDGTISIERTNGTKVSLEFER